MQKKLYGPYDVAHPAVFSWQLIPMFSVILRKHILNKYPIEILDPFAGVGKIHELMDDPVYGWQFSTHGLEIAPKWAKCHPRTKTGDVLQLRKHYRRTFDAIVTSPCYGNRFADHHNAQDGSLRRSYFHDYGDDLPIENNAGLMHWGPAYCDFHEEAWARVVGVLRTRGLFILNCKNHIRNGKEQKVCEWHLKTLRTYGMVREKTITVNTPGMRAGENRDLRCPERIYVLRKQ